MLDFQVKKLQQRYTEELSEALDKLEQNYHSMRHEAFEKLVNKHCKLRATTCIQMHYL